MTIIKRTWIIHNITQHLSWRIKQRRRISNSSYIINLPNIQHYRHPTSRFSYMNNYPLHIIVNLKINNLRHHRNSNNSSIRNIKILQLHINTTKSKTITNRHYINSQINTCKITILLIMTIFSYSLIKNIRNRTNNPLRIKRRVLLISRHISIKKYFTIHMKWKIDIITHYSVKFEHNKFVRHYSCSYQTRNRIQRRNWQHKCKTATLFKIYLRYIRCNYSILNTTRYRNRFRSSTSYIRSNTHFILSTDILNVHKKWPNWNTNSTTRSSTKIS